jgi:hypothetical protein
MCDFAGVAAILAAGNSRPGEYKLGLLMIPGAARCGLLGDFVSQSAGLLQTKSPVYLGSYLKRRNHEETA